MKIYFSNEEQIVLQPLSYKFPIYLRRGTTDNLVFEQIIVSNRFDFNFTFNPKLIIDAGAYIGITSSYFANKYPSAKIFAIEPEISNYNQMMMNISSYENVIPIKGALWKNNSSLSIQNPKAEKWAFQFSENSHGENGQISTVTPDDILQMSDMKLIDLFKIDIEGK